MQHAGLVGRGEPVRNTAEQLDRVAPAVAFLPPLPEGSSVNELRDEVLPALELARVVHRHDVRVIERRGRVRFAFEAAAGGGPCEIVGQKFDGYASVQFSVEGPVDDTHTAGANRGFYLVDAEPKTREVLCLMTAEHLGRNFRSGAIQKALRALCAAEKRVQLEPEVVIAIALGLHECVPLVRRSFEG